VTIIAPSAVLTLALQEVLAVLTLGLGLVALRVAPRPGPSTRTAAWFMAGVTFTCDGTQSLVHSTAAVAAMAAGSESRFYAVVVRLTPLANDARALLILGFALGLGWVVLLERPMPAPGVVVGSAIALAAVGFIAGLAEGPLRRGGVHFGVLSLFGAATAVLLFASLYRGMMRGSVDWLFWVALALYAAQEALSSNIQGVLSWAGFGGAWAPPVPSQMWIGLFSSCVMLACTLRRLAIAREGGDPPGLMERLRG
jgi:hypothetical protein